MCEQVGRFKDDVDRMKHDGKILLNIVSKVNSTRVHMFIKFNQFIKLSNLWFSSSLLILQVRTRLQGYRKHLKSGGPDQ